MLKLDDDFYKEEVRCGFKVTEKRKRVWAVELHLLNEFDIFAKKYNLKYYAGFGTLLGAVRHKGFIPWDDDVDIFMMRDEYMKMAKYAREYFCGQAINGRRMVFEDAYSKNTVFKSYISKIRDCETTIAEPFMIENGTFAGISIDIFPYDATFDGTETMARNTRIAYELWLCFVIGKGDPDNVKQALGGASILGDEILKKVCSLPDDDRMKLFENHALSMWGKSSKVYLFYSSLVYDGKYDNDLDLWSDACELPFENLMVPAPVAWDKVLRDIYGDYNEFVMGGSLHENSYYDPDTPFYEYEKGRIRIPEDWDGSL